MEILRKRNTATTIYFPMIKAGSQDFATSSDWTPANADSQYSKDGAAFGATNGTVTYEGEGIWSLALLAGEVDGKVTAISIIDDATKAVEDQAIILSTYGDDSSQHPLNLLADFVLKRNMGTSRGTTDGDKTGRFILQAFSFLRNKREDDAGTLRVYQENDTTEDWNAVLGTAAGADPIDSVDPS